MYIIKWYWEFDVSEFKGLYLETQNEKEHHITQNA